MRRLAMFGLAALLTGLVPGQPGWAEDMAPDKTPDNTLAPGSTLSAVLESGKLRVCFEAGYLPFGMIGARSGLRERSLRPADSRPRARSTRLAADAPHLDSMLPGGAATAGWGSRAAGPDQSSTRPLDHPADGPKDRAFGGRRTSIFLIGILLNRYPRVTLEQFQVVPTRKP